MKVSQKIETTMKNLWVRPVLWAGVLVCVNIFPIEYSGANGQQKVTICHKGTTISIAEPAVRAHLEHGDTLGSCVVTENKNK